MYVCFISYINMCVPIYICIYTLQIHTSHMMIGCVSCEPAHGLRTKRPQVTCSHARNQQNATWINATLTVRLLLH